MTVLALEHVTIRYGDFLAVEDLTLQVEAGEILGLLGPNGSGKSSTLAAIAGGKPPQQGSIRLAGCRESDDPLTYRQHIGLVPQELALFEELTAEQNLAFFGRLYGLRGLTLQQRLSEVLGFVQLREQARRPVRTFSGGMQRRLNLGCALLHQPRLLLLDEPTVGLDIQSREAIFACLRQLRDQGTAMVFTTHHLEEVEQICDRIAILNHGRILATGTLGQLCGSISGWRWDGPHRSGRSAPQAGRGSALEQLFLHLTGRSLGNA